jgi:penicillin amidase
VIKRVLFAAVVLFVLAIATLAIISTNAVKKSLPQVSGEINLTGLESPVEVLRDEFGIPHIKAQSEQDMYRALGFVNAQDRLWQMDVFRRISHGRLAEVLGPKLIALDKKHRVLGFRRLAERLYEKADAKSKAICSAYVDGINYYIDGSAGKLPPEFRLLKYEPEKWSPNDVYSVLMWQQWMVTFNWESELAVVALIQKFGPEEAAELISFPAVEGPTIIPETDKQYSPAPSRKDGTIIPPEIDYSQIRFEAVEKNSAGPHALLMKSRSEVYASNAWAVAGERSSSGEPILCNDPHIPHTLPSIWYMAHLSAPGIDAAGIMTLGVPMIVMGHTRHIAWGDTTAVADTQDLYLEKLNPDNPDEYLSGDTYRPFDVQKETITYRDDGEMKELEITIRSTVHGTIINEIAEPPVSPDAPLALQWTGYETGDMIMAGDMMLKAKGWDGFREALSHVSTPVWNWVYADSSGNIGYQLVGKIPIRERGRGLVPVPGWIDDYEWEGTIPYDEMPRLFNPSCGYIVTANNPITPDDYPYLISTRFAPPHRAARIKELVLENDTTTPEHMRRVQMDVYSKQGDLMRDIFVAACEKHPQPGPDFGRAVELLRDWDLIADAESRGAAIFYESHATIARNIFKARLGADLWEKIYRSIASLDDLIATGSSGKWFDDPATELVETRDETIAAGIAEAVTSLRDFFNDGPDAWKWGDIHTLTFSHPLGQKGVLAKVFNVGPYPVGGAMSTVNPGVYFFNRDEKPYKVWAGPSMRTVIDFADVDATEMVITLGQSGHRLSPHYADQLSYWLKGKSIPFYGKEQAREIRLVLLPAKN